MKNSLKEDSSIGYISSICNSLTIGICVLITTCNKYSIDELEARLSKASAPAEVTYSNNEKDDDRVSPKIVAPKTGDSVRLNMVAEKPDEIYRDMTVVSSLKNTQGTACRFSRLREVISVLEVRNNFVLVQYNSYATVQHLDTWRAEWFYTTVASFCNDGDIGIMTLRDFDRYRDIDNDGSSLRDEQRQEVERARAQFTDLLPGTATEGI